LECVLESSDVSEEIKESFLRPSFNCSRLLLFFVKDLVDYVTNRTNQVIKLDYNPVDLRDMANNIKELF